MIARRLKGIPPASPISIADIVAGLPEPPEMGEKKRQLSALLERYATLTGEAAEVDAMPVREVVFGPLLDRRRETEAELNAVREKIETLRAEIAAAKREHDERVAAALDPAMGDAIAAAAGALSALLDQLQAVAAGAQAYRRLGMPDRLRGAGVSELMALRQMIAAVPGARLNALLSKHAEHDRLVLAAE